MTKLGMQCRVVVPRVPRSSGLLITRHLATVVEKNVHPTRYERSPAAKTVVKVMPLESFWWNTSTTEDRQILTDLLTAIRSRSPNKIIETLHEIQRHNKTQLLNDAHLQAVLRCMRPSDYFKAPHSKNSYQIYRKRMIFLRRWIASSGIKCSREIYFLILEEARLVKVYSGADRLAVETWSDMLAAGIQPDVHCYNSFIGATCIQPAALDKARLRRRTDDHKRKRDRIYRLEKAELAVQRAIGIYREMLKRGVEPNSMTIELLIVALGWCANFSGLKSLILQTWNILLPEPDSVSLEDQGIPDEYDEEGIDLADKVDSPVNVAKVLPGSGIFPTQETLVAVAAAFGVSQQSKVAVHAIRLIARVYGLTISTKVWTELMKWSSADSEYLDGFTSHGQVDWIMTLAKDEYGTVPSPSMYGSVIQHSLIGERISDRTYQLVDEMLTSLTRDAPTDQLPFKYTERCPHARQIAIGAMIKAKRNRSGPLGQLVRRLERAKANGGSDEIRLLENDIARRTTDLEHQMNAWSIRIRQFDDEIDKLKEIQAADTRMQQASSENTQPELEHTRC